MDSKSMIGAFEYLDSVQSWIIGTGKDESDKNLDLTSA